MSQLIKSNESEHLKKIAEDTKKQLQEMNTEIEKSVKQNDMEEYDSKVEQRDKVIQDRKKKFKKEKKATLIGAGVFFGVCLLTPPFGWAVGAGAVTGLACGHVINKTIDAVEKKTKKSSKSKSFKDTKKKNKTENDDVVWGEN